MQPPAAPSAPPPYGPQPYWAPPRRSPGNQVAIVIVAVAVAVFVLMALLVFSLLGFGRGSFTIMWFAPFCVVLLVLVVFVVLAAVGAFRRTSLPPPPPIQQPMVPAGTQGPIALSCPNCGAPPVSVDRFGVATCTYCGTRFIVR